MCLRGRILIAPRQRGSSDDVMVVRVVWSSMHQGGKFESVPNTFSKNEHTCMCMVHTSGTPTRLRREERQCGFTTESTRHAVLQTPSRIIVVCRIIVVGARARGRGCSARSVSCSIWGWALSCIKVFQSAQNPVKVKHSCAQLYCIAHLLNVMPRSLPDKPDVAYSCGIWQLLGRTSALQRSDVCDLMLHLSA